MFSSFADNRRDIEAALALAAIAIPEQIATSRLAGAPPAIGLLVFIAGSVGFFLLGYNRYISVGADSTIAPIFAAALAGMAASTTPQYIALAALVALMAGALVCLSGLLKMGWMARLLSVPVITGFLAGISVHIALSQLPALLGIPSGGPELVGLVKGLAANITHVNPIAVAIGLGVFVATLISEKLDCRFPAPLIALIACALVVKWLGLAAHGVSVLGTIQRPPFMPPHIIVSDVIMVLPISFLVALVIIIQTTTVSRSMLETGETGNLNRDLMGAGLGNIFSGLLGGFAVNSSPPRTAIVRETDAASRLAGLMAAVIIAVLYLFGTQSAGRRSCGSARWPSAFRVATHFPFEYHAQHRQSEPAGVCTTLCHRGSDYPRAGANRRCHWGHPVVDVRRMDRCANTRSRVRAGARLDGMVASRTQFRRRKAAWDHGGGISSAALLPQRGLLPHKLG